MTNFPYVFLNKELSSPPLLRMLQSQTKLSSQVAVDFLTALTKCWTVSPGHLLGEMKVMMGSQKATAPLQCMLVRQPWDLNHFKDAYDLARYDSPCLVTGPTPQLGGDWKADVGVTKLVGGFSLPSSLQRTLLSHSSCNSDAIHRVFLKWSVGRHQTNSAYFKNYLRKINCVVVFNINNFTALL